MSFGVSLVTYNSAGVIADCLKSIPSSIPVYIADNGSRDDTMAVAQAIRPDAHIKRMRRNIGFGRAHNYNMRRISGDVLVLNPDTILLPGCLDALQAAAQSYPDAGLIGALHQQADGTPNSCFKNDLDYYPQLIRDRTVCRKTKFSAPQGDVCVEQVTGALMLIKRDALRVVKGFYPKLFMYFEDDDLCARIRQAGFTVILAAAAKVIHLEGKSSHTQSFKVDYIKGYHFERSRKIAHAHYHGRDMAFYKLIISGLVRCLRRATRYRLKNDIGRTVFYLAGMMGLLSPLPNIKRR